MVIYRNVHVALDQIFDCCFQVSLIIERINPKLIDVPGCIPSVFQSHQCDMFNEGQIPVCVFDHFCQPRDREFVQDYPNLCTNAVARQLMKSCHRLIECALGLNDIVVITRVNPNRAARLR